MSVSAPHVVTVPAILYPGPGVGSTRCVAYLGDIVRYRDPAALERALEQGFIAPAPADDDAPPAAPAHEVGPVAAAAPARHESGPPAPAARPPFTAPKSAWIAFAVAAGHIGAAAAAAASKHDLIELCS